MIWVCVRIYIWITFEKQTFTFLGRLFRATTIRELTVVSRVISSHSGIFDAYKPLSGTESNYHVLRYADEVWKGTWKRKYGVWRSRNIEVIHWWWSGGILLFYQYSESVVSSEGTSSTKRMTHILRLVDKNGKFQWETHGRINLR